MLTMAVEKGAIMAPEWSHGPSAYLMSLSLVAGRACSERPRAVKGAPLLGAAKRTLDGEDRSKMIEKRERRGEHLTKGGGAIMAPSPGATDTYAAISGRAR
jgi:hypothetical protein